MLHGGSEMRRSQKKRSLKWGRLSEFQHEGKETDIWTRDVDGREECLVTRANLQDWYHCQNQHHSVILLLLLIRQGMACDVIIEDICFSKVIPIVGFNTHPPSEQAWNSDRLIQRLRTVLSMRCSQLLWMGVDEDDRSELPLLNGKKSLEEEKSGKSSVDARSLSISAKIRRETSVTRKGKNHPADGQ